MGYYYIGMSTKSSTPYPGSFPPRRLGQLCSACEPTTAIYWPILSMIPACWYPAWYPANCTRLGTDRRTSLVMTCHFCASPLRRHAAQTLPIAYVATSGICLTVGPGHRAIPRWKEGNVLLPTVHRCVSGFNCETDARRSSVCSRQRLRCIKGPQGKSSTTLLQLSICLADGPRHRAIHRWKEGNALLLIVCRCISDFNCEPDARRSNVCSRQRLRSIKRQGSFNGGAIPTRVPVPLGERECFGRGAPAATLAQLSQHAR